jgi:predicted GIY-YIG superfamily endonuclease
MADRAEKGRPYLYILKDRKGVITYNGYTTNPRRRIRQHNGEIVGGAKATSQVARRPWSFLVIFWDAHGHMTTNQALSLEWHIRQPQMGCGDKQTWRSLLGMKERVDGKRESKQKRPAALQGPGGRLLGLLVALRKPAFRVKTEWKLRFHVDDAWKERFRDLLHTYPPPQAWELCDEIQMVEEEGDAGNDHRLEEDFGPFHIHSIGVDEGPNHGDDYHANVKAESLSKEETEEQGTNEQNGEEIQPIIDDHA